MNILILPGGGSNGDWQAGRLVRLMEEGLQPDLIVTTSVGALNGIMAATRQQSELRGIWMNLKPGHVKKKRPVAGLGINYLGHRLGIARPHLGVWSNAPLRSLLENHLLGKKVYIDYQCSVVRVGDGVAPDRYMKYQIHAGTTMESWHIDHILASTAIPVVFDPVVQDYGKLVDGGVHQASPIRDTIRTTPVTKMTAIACQPVTDVPVEDPKDIVGMAAWTITTIMRDKFLQEWREMERWNQAAAQSPGLVIDGHLVQQIENELHFPAHDLGNSLNFSNKKTAPNFLKGYNL